MLEKVKGELVKKDLQPIIKKCVVFIVLFVGVFFLEKDHLLRSSVADDLSIKSFCNINFFEAVCKNGYKFRPVSNAAIWVVAKICNGNLYLFGYINLLIAAICAFVIFNFIYKHSKSYILSLAAGILYIVSRFSYYQITTQHGIIESASTLLVIIFFWYLFQYMDKHQSKDYYVALAVYALCSLSHERYLVLMPVMLYAWFVSEKKGNILRKENFPQYKKPFITIAVFSVIMLLFYFLVNNIMTGTGGTNVMKTISVMSVIKNLCKSIAYLFSVNSPEVYLSMVGWSGYSTNIKIVVICSIMMIFLMTAIGIFDIIKMEKIDRKKHLSILGMFILSIFAMIFISSVTIRVELRWMYAPYMAMVFILVYLFRIKANKLFKLLKCLCFYTYVILMVVFSIYCRDCYGSLYYFGDYTFANELTDDTYGVYGDEMYLRSWVLIAPYDETRFPYTKVLKSFDVNDSYELHLEVITSINELAYIDGIQNKEVLYYDVEKTDFINISKMVRDYYAPPTT